MVCKLDSAMGGVDGAVLMVHASTIQPCAGWLVRGGWCMQARFSDARGGWCMNGAQARFSDALVDGACKHDSAMRGADGAQALFGDTRGGYCASRTRRCAGWKVRKHDARGGWCMQARFGDARG